MPYEELRPLLDHRWRVAEMDVDPVWWELSKLIDERLGLLMAARAEMQKALQKDKTRRAVRHAEMRVRQRKGNLRDL